VGLDLTHRLRILLFTSSNVQGKGFSHSPRNLERVKRLEELGVGSGIVKMLWTTSNDKLDLLILETLGKVGCHVGKTRLPGKVQFEAERFEVHTVSA
jgi:hypothetical protein